MSNIPGAQAQAKRFAHQTSDVKDIRDNLQDIGNSVGDMATRQYERAHDTVSDALRETSGAIQRNPLAAIGIGLDSASSSALSVADAASRILGARREPTT